VLIFFIAGLLYLLRFERVDNLGAYSIPSDTGLLIPSDYINYRKPETVDKTIGDGALMWFYLSCNSYDWPCWAILKIGKKMARPTMTTP